MSTSGDPTSLEAIEHEVKYMAPRSCILDDSSMASGYKPDLLPTSCVVLDNCWYIVITRQVSIYIPHNIQDSTWYPFCAR